MNQPDAEEIVADASDVIGHAPTVLRAGDLVVLYARVSTAEQKRSGHLERQTEYLRRFAAEANLIVVAEVAIVSPGWSGERLIDATETARTLSAAILAHTTDRLVRNVLWWPEQKAVPTRSDLQQLTALVPAGVRLVTVAAPDSSAEEIRSEHTRRGQAMSGRKGGRPRSVDPGTKKRRRVELLPRVQELRGEGHSVREIAQQLGLPTMTVSDWLHRG